MSYYCHFLAELFLHAYVAQLLLILHRTADLSQENYAAKLRKDKDFEHKFCCIMVFFTADCPPKNTNKDLKRPKINLVM